MNGPVTDRDPEHTAETQPADETTADPADDVRSEPGADADAEADGAAGGVAGGDGPGRWWYLVAVGVLVVGVAAGFGLAGFAIGGSRSAVRVVGGLVGAFGCPIGGFLVAGVIGLLVALRRSAARRRAG